MRGCKGLAFGGKAHLLDCMEILTGLWNKDQKYAFNSAVMRCWRKTNILPISWDNDINNTVGSRSVPQKDKITSKQDCWNYTFSISPRQSI